MMPTQIVSHTLTVRKFWTSADLALFVSYLHGLDAQEGYLETLLDGISADDAAPGKEAIEKLHAHMQIMEAGRAALKNLVEINSSYAQVRARELIAQHRVAGIEGAKKYQSTQESDGAWSLQE